LSSDGDAGENSNVITTQFQDADERIIL
jgi:hypothetical protein